MKQVTRCIYPGNLEKPGAQWCISQSRSRKSLGESTWQSGGKTRYSMNASFNLDQASKPLGRSNDVNLDQTSYSANLPCHLIQTSHSVSPPVCTDEANYLVHLPFQARSQVARQVYPWIWIKQATRWELPFQYISSKLLREFTLPSRSNKSLCESTCLYWWSKLPGAFTFFKLSQASHSASLPMNITHASHSMRVALWIYIKQVTRRIYPAC